VPLNSSSVNIVTDLQAEGLRLDSR